MKKHDRSLQKYFWTGLRDTNARGEYSWAVTGGQKQAMTFSNWNFLEPGECLIKDWQRELQGRVHKDRAGAALSPRLSRCNRLAVARSLVCEACLCLFGFPRRQGQLEGCVALGTERSSRRKSDSQEAINEHCAKSTCDSDFMIFPKAHCSKVRGGRDSLEKQKLFSCLGFNIYSKCWHVKDYYTHAKWS